MTPHYCTSLRLTFALFLSAGSAAAQSTEDVNRLSGVTTVDVRVEANWDETITMDAGGATADQFSQALRMTFEETISSAKIAPVVQPNARYTIACHVDTFYEPGQIIYSLRTQLEEADADGAPVIRWIRSWVGSFNMQQMHVMFTLGQACAERFLGDWRSVNSRRPS
ncbi:MAG TPA: hypothetical protein DG084_01830 [Gemmatimonadetes bacterium]|nr:hypothetical protein [Gemmatimonadota bacterium]